MKTLSIVLAAVSLAVSGTAHANCLVDAMFPNASKSEERKASKLDYRPTGSIARTPKDARPLTSQKARAAETDTPKLGIGVSPWMMPLYN